jgi:hypothetical protein
MDDLWRIDLIVQVGDHGTPGPFPTLVAATTPMHAWAGAVQSLRAHAQRHSWGTDQYRVLSYGAFQKITNEMKENS